MPNLPYTLVSVHMDVVTDKMYGLCFHSPCTIIIPWKIFDLKQYMWAVIVTR